MLKFFPVWGSIRLLGSRGKLRLCPAIRHSSEFRSLWWSAFQHPHSQLDQGSTPRRSSSAGGQRGKGLLFSLSTWSNKQAGRSRRVDKTLGIMWSVDGAVQESEVTAKEMLTSNPSGAYTTLRTVEHGAPTVHSPSCPVFSGCVDSLCPRSAPYSEPTLSLHSLTRTLGGLQQGRQCFNWTHIWIDLPPHWTSSEAKRRMVLP
eukprot:m.23851 g.23851  ORF g.23851 m.23851 type:complete len:203 (+) comp6001_c0_seq1:171-779(+)